jgi:hypothetical protein
MGRFVFLAEEKTMSETKAQNTKTPRGRNVGVNLPDDLIDRVHLDAIRRGISVRQLFCDALNSYAPRDLRCVTDSRTATRVK